MEGRKYNGVYFKTIPTPEGGYRMLIIRVAGKSGRYPLSVLFLQGYSVNIKRNGML